MKLSIITINWNNRDGLRMTMDNVLGQSARDQFEYIVVDGGAPDGSKEMLESEYAGKVNKWVSEPIKPIYQKMNMGARMATGDYLLYLNSGDVFHGENAIGDVIDQLHGEDIIVGKMIFLATGLLMQAPNPITLLSMYDRSLPHNAAFIKRELLIKYPYDENLKIVSDWKFFVQALIVGNASYRLIDNIVAEFDCGGLSSKNRDLCEVERAKALKELFPERVLEDYFTFIHGAGYTGSTYDRFYVKLKHYRSGKHLYALNRFLLLILSKFKKSAKWVEDFPPKL